MPPTLEQLLAQGQSLLAANRLAEAEQHARQVAAQHPHHAAYHALGVALIYSKKQTEAIAAFDQSLTLHPTPEAFLNLIQLLFFAGHKSQSVTLARTAIAAFPDDPRLVAELARALERTGDSDAALLACQTALARFPNMPLLVAQAGTLLFTRGKIAEAIALCRNCLRAHPDNSKLHSALLFALHFLPGTTPQQLLAEHLDWNRSHAAHLAPLVPPRSDIRNPNRPLRIGYVSPDFKNHGIGRFIAPLLAHHARDQFDIFAYSDAHTPDAITQRIQKSVRIFRSTFQLDDAQLADLIRADQIDILVDLTMHMPSNRLLVFARKPAPIQLTYLAYCSTTGLSAMDYRFTDPFLEGTESNTGILPASLHTAAHYSEKSLLLPSYWCYEAPSPLPPVAPRDPARPITFGCLNNFAKASPQALETWAAILRSVPYSRLLLHAPDGKIREEIDHTFQSRGITPDRIQFCGRVPTDAYLQLHAQTDIALDPFPYAGGTTTCDALFMGTPVIALAPPPNALPTSRAGISILSQLGLQRFIARDVPHYVELATALALNSAELAVLRSTLRTTMQNSPLMDASAFTRHVEDAYRHIWRAQLAAPQG